MCEPPWRMELAQIQKDEEVRYITTVFAWFQWWRIRSGAWPLLPRSEFNLSKKMRDRVYSHLVLTLAKVEMLMGEMQALKALITFQCIAEAGPRRPPPGYVCQCVESIMHPLSAIGITFSVDSVLTSAASSRSRSTSLKTNVSWLTCHRCHPVWGQLGTWLKRSIRKLTWRLAQWGLKSRQG